MMMMLVISDNSKGNNNYFSFKNINIGEKARRQHVLNPKNTFTSVKRIIGRTLKELASNGEKLSTHKIDKKLRKLDLNSEEINISCPNLERDITPIEISSEILKNLVKEASAYLGGEIITKAVITVPAYFLPAQCDATIKAGKCYSRTLCK